LPEKRKCTKNQDLESKDSQPKDLESKESGPTESCWNIMNFFKTLEEMETRKISEKSGRNICKGPVGSEIEYSYHIKINNSEEREKESRRPVFLKLKPKKKFRN
jgi:hypothetical protein